MMLRRRFARLLAWVATASFLLSAYILLVDGFSYKLPFITLSAKSPLTPFLTFVVLTVVATVLGPLPWRSTPVLRVLFAWLRSRPLIRYGSLAAVVLAIVLLVGGRWHQSHYIKKGNKLMASGEAAGSAEYFRRAAMWPFGEQEYAKSYRSCMLFASQQFDTCIDENLPDFQAGVRMRSTRYRCLWSCLGEKGRYEEALQVLEASIQTYAGMAKYAPAGDLFKRQILQHKGEAGRRVTVKFAFNGAEDARALRLRGSFTSDGRQSEVDGWRSAVEMSKGPEGWTLELPLALSGRLPYASVLEANHEGDTWEPVASSHFWVSGEDEQVEAKVYPLAESEPPPREPWQKLPADGRPRTLVVWPDGGSWFFLNTLRERGGLPNIQRFLETAAFGKMISTHPPFTATAYLKMVRVDDGKGDEGEDKSFFDMLALQLKGIPFLDWAFDNELGSLGDDPYSIFNILRKNGYSAVNLVFSDKYMSAPDDAGLLAGMKYQQTITAALSPEQTLEELGIDATKEPQRARRITRSRAFRAAYNNSAGKALIGQKVWESGDDDLVLLRFPAVDILSHQYAAEAFEKPTESLLFEIYRQLDIHMGRLMEKMDGDDTLILVSDHGVEGALSHHPDCVLAVSGPGVKVGARLPQVSIGQLPHIILSRFSSEIAELDLDEGLAEHLGVASSAAVPSEASDSVAPAH